MILVLGGEKGGSGKSCLAQNLSVWLQRRGHDVLLIDADPQGTSVDWAREREENPDLPDIQVESAHGDIRKKLLDRAKGILMQAHNISESEAYRRMQRYSMEKRLSLKEVAAAVVKAGSKRKK